MTGVSALGQSSSDVVTHLTQMRISSPAFAAGAVWENFAAYEEKQENDTKNT